MGMYSIHFYGTDLTEKYGDLPEEISERFYETRGDAQSWGETNYDGGGYGQISFIGVSVPRGPKGYVVTPEVEEAARKAYEACPADVRAAVCKVLGVESLPAPEFHVLEGWG